MKFIFLPLLLLFTFTAIAQTESTNAGKQKKKQLSPAEKQQIVYELDKRSARIDSIYQYMRPILKESDSLSRILHYGAFTPHYTALLLNFGVARADISALNAELSENGFESLRDQFVAVGWGFAGRGKRFLHELHLQAFLPNKSEKEGFKVRIEGGHISYHLGYDLINTEVVQLYPTAGIFLQPLLLHVQQLQPQQGSYNCALALANDYSTTTLRRAAAGADLGGQLDVRLSNPYQGPGIILSLRAGISEALIRGNYRINEKQKVDLNLPVDLQNAYFSFAIKFY